MKNYETDQNKNRNNIPLPDEVTSVSSRGWQMLSKVPEVTIFFWIIKIMATTVGETGATS